MSAMKESLSHSLSRISSRPKRRSKKLRRQTGTIDVSYATDYYPPLPTHKSDARLPEADVVAYFDDEEDDLSETISGPTHSGSVETVDRLSVLSDSVPELVDADSLSQMSISDQVSASEAAGEAGGWRTIPIQIVPTTEIVIHRCDADADASPAPVIREKRKSVSPVPEADPEEAEGRDDKASQPNDVTRDEDVTRDAVASVPATPRSEEKRARSKKSKFSSPASALLEKSASWLSSLSGSKGQSGGPKEKKSSNKLSSTQKTKKSLTSLFEAVASSASSNNNGSSSSSIGNAKKQNKM
jgi:hypothetical protein